MQEVMHSAMPWVNTMKEKQGHLILLKLTCCVWILFTLTACDQVVQKHESRQLEAAYDASRQGNYPEALSLFEAALTDSPEAAEIHFQMALICESKVHDLMGAFFHFRRCERIAPQGRHASEARQSMARLEPLLMASFADDGMISKRDAAGLKNENQALRKQIAQLRAQLAAMPRPPVDKNARNTPPDPELIKKMGGRTYTVEPGDTLAKIALRFYKSRNRSKDIQDANINNLPDPRKLQVGQVLIIPQ